MFCGRRKIINLLIILFTVHSLPVKGQTGTEPKSKALSFEYGVGSLFAKDKYITNNSYIGNSNQMQLSWIKKHDKYFYTLDFSSIKSAVENYTISAEVKNFTIYQGFLYELNSLNIFKKDLKMYLGPQTNFNIHYREQNVAGNMLSRSYSGAFLASLALGYTIEYCFFSKALIYNKLNINILSLAGRMPDFTLDEYKILRISTVFSTTSLSNNLILQYQLTKSFNVLIDYNFQLLNYTDTFAGTTWEQEGWSTLLLTSNNIALGLRLWF